MGAHSFMSVVAVSNSESTLRHTAVGNCTETSVCLPMKILELGLEVIKYESIQPKSNLQFDSFGI